MMTESKKATTSRGAAKPCPICGKPQLEKFRPFCSRRCADIDLHRWLGGAYAIPAEQEEPEDDKAPPPDEDQT